MTPQSPEPNCHGPGTAQQWPSVKPGHSARLRHDGPRTGQSEDLRAVTAERPPLFPAHTEACNCIGGAVGDGKTCWYCINGQHERCTANQHGDRAAKCPRTSAAPGSAAGMAPAGDLIPAGASQADPGGRAGDASARPAQPEKPAGVIPHPSAGGALTTPPYVVMRRTDVDANLEDLAHLRNDHRQLHSDLTLARRHNAELSERLSETEAALDHSRAEARASAEALKLSHEWRDELAQKLTDADEIIERQRDEITSLQCRIQELEPPR